MAVSKEPTSFRIKVILMTTGCIHIHVETSVTVSEWKLAVHIWAGCTDHQQGPERSLYYEFHLSLIC